MKSANIITSVYSSLLVFSILNTSLAIASPVISNSTKSSSKINIIEETFRQSIQSNFDSELVFSIESDLPAEIVIGNSDVFSCSHKYYEEDIVSNLIHNIPELVIALVIEYRYSVMFYLFIFITLFTIAIKRSTNLRTLAFILSISLFTAGIFYDFI